MLTKLAALLAYDPIIGDLTWKPVPGSDWHNRLKAGQSAVVRNREGWAAVYLDGMRLDAPTVAFWLASGVWTPCALINWSEGLQATNLVTLNITMVANGFEAWGWGRDERHSLGVYETLADAACAVQAVSSPSTDS